MLLLTTVSVKEIVRVSLIDAQSKMDKQYNLDKTMDISAQVHHILVIEDPSFEKEINLDGATYSIGRHSSNDIVLSCQKTSRNHATLLRRTDVKTNNYSYWILDGDLQGNRSRNGIYINGKKSLVHELKQGDVIQFSGDAQAKYKITTHLPENISTTNDKDPDVTRLQIDNKPLVNKDTVNKDTIVATPQKAIDSSQSWESSRQNSFAELSPQPIIEIDLSGNITYINSAGIINFQEIYHQKLNHPLLENLTAQYHNQEENIIIREVKIGKKTFLQNAHYLSEKKVIRNYLVDITHQKDLVSQLEYQVELYNKIVEQVSEGIIIVETATKKIIEVNSSCCKLLGYSAAEMLHMNVYELSSESEKLAAVLQRVIAEKNSFWGECLFHHQNGNIVNAQLKIDLIDSDLDEKLCLVIHNSTEHQYLAENIKNISGIDLSKRDIFNQQLLTAIANAKRSQKLLAVMFCNIDFLPDIRATIGIANSNQLLANLGQRLSTCLRSGDTVVHWQEDKFALLMPQISGVEEVAKINQRIQKSIEQSFKIGDIHITAKSTIGIAIYPQDGGDVDILLANANMALERAHQHKISYQFYDGAMNTQALVTLELETLLQQALDKEEFKLYYQPQINIDTGKLEVIEALLRWEHPELGLVTPNNFIKAAEKSKLIIPIGEWAIRTACKQNKAWQSQGLPALKMTVILSSVQFQQPNLVQKIAEILAETALEPQLLELEIGAESLIQNIEHSQLLLKQLQTLGVHIAVDDFTAGFSYLEYLKQFPLNTLKIDRCLVQQLTNNPKDLAIVTALIELGKGFNLRVVAEGVETQEQVELLRSLNCQYMQGFWFSRPLAAEEASKLLPFNYSEEELESLKQNSPNLNED